MLTSDLLVTRINKEKIEPSYAQLDQKNLEIAASILNVFQEHIGRPYGELIDEVEGFEEINYRLIRGLTQTLERRCVINTDSVLDPTAARRAVFLESRGVNTNEKMRTEILISVARKLKIKPDDLEKALWADQEENLIVRSFQTIPPANLLKEYNLSLAQTLLFKATGMEIRFEDNYQQIFRRIKQLGLIYTILDDQKIYLDGPISLFKLTEKYGTALAKLLPFIIKSGRWSLKASILKKTPHGNRIYYFMLDHTKKEILSTDSGIEKTLRFDSVIEKEFYQLSFNGWMVNREPTILKAGQHAFIPDFSMERNGIKVYVEIVGYWTPEYLKNKIQKLNKLKEKESMILLIDRNLACSGSEIQTDNLIFYDKKIPYLEIIKILRKYEKKQLVEDIAKLRDIRITLDSDLGIFSLDEAAKRFGVSLEALREVIKSQDKTDFLLIGDQLVSNQILDTIRSELNDVKKYTIALKIFDRYGIEAHSQALQFLGYKVKWSGLDTENTEILEK